MIDRCIGAFIVGFWLVMMSLLVWWDLIPQWRVNQPPSYKTMLEHRLQAEKYRMGIWWGDRRLGASGTTIEPETDGSYTIENDTDLATTFPGLAHLTLRSRTRIGNDYRLHNSSTDIRAGEFEGNMSAEVVGKRLKIKFQLAGADSFEHEVPYESAGTFSNGLSPFIQMPDLTVGKEWTIYAMNPLTGQAETGLARVQEIETIAWQGLDVETFRVTMTQARQEATSWIDRQGHILKEEVPFLSSKLVMIREKGE